MSTVLSYLGEAKVESPYVSAAYQGYATFLQMDAFSYSAGRRGRGLHLHYGLDSTLGNDI